MDNQKISVPQHSEEIQEIIGRPPGWILRSGITIITVVLLILLFLGRFVKYPDSLSADVIITTSPPPQVLVSKASGNVTILKNEGEKVLPGGIIAYIGMEGSPSDVLSLEAAVSDSSARNFVFEGHFGELQSFYSKFLNDHLALTTLQKSKNISIQIKILHAQFATLKKVGRILLSQSILLKEETSLASQKFKTDSLLYKQNVLSAVDFNDSKAKYLQQRRTFENSKEAVFNNAFQCNQLQQQILDLELSRTEQLEKLKLAKENSRRELLTAIARWKDAHLMISECGGIVAYIGSIETNTFVEQGKSLITVIPNSNRLQAKAKLPISGSGKVKVGQVVNLQLANYPHEQFGTVSGHISAISLVPNEGNYLVTIALPKGLQTSQNIQLLFKEQLSGVTQIITEDLTLLDRLFFSARRITNINPLPPGPRESE